MNYRAYYYFAGIQFDIENLMHIMASLGLLVCIAWALSSLIRQRAIQWRKCVPSIGSIFLKITIIRGPCLMYLWWRQNPQQKGGGVVNNGVLYSSIM